MKLTGTLLFFLLPLSLYAGPITQKPLDEFVIYDIPVASKSGTTTVMFPSEISGLFAKSVSAQEQENAGFLISFTPGNFYFSIRALKPDTEDCLKMIFNGSPGDLMKRLYLEEPARKKAAAIYKAQNPEFKEKQIHQKAEVTKIDILDTRKINDGAGKSYEAVSVRAESNLIRTGTVNKLEFREPVKFQTEFLFIRNPDLLGNGRLPLVVQDFKYSETPL